MASTNATLKPRDGTTSVTKPRRSQLRPQALRVGGSDRSDTGSHPNLREARNGKTAEAEANSYRMVPDDDKSFVSHKVEYLVKDILEAYLRNVKYEPTHCSKLAQDLCSIIKGKVKEMDYDRYRLVTQVVVGQDSDQSVQVASRCLWNHNTDNFAAATYRNNSLYAIAIVYALYLD